MHHAFVLNFIFNSIWIKNIGSETNAVFDVLFKEIIILLAGVSIAAADGSDGGDIDRRFLFSLVVIASDTIEFIWRPFI